MIIYDKGTHLFTYKFFSFPLALCTRGPKQCDTPITISILSIWVVTSKIQFLLKETRAF